MAGNTTDLDGGGERRGFFGVASRNTAPSFEKEKSILNEMAEFVQIFIVSPLVFTVFSRSCRCCSPAVFCSPATFEDYYITFLLTTLSRKSANTKFFGAYQQQK